MANADEYRPYLENYTVDASIFVVKIIKCKWRMPRHQKPTKDV